MGKVLYVNFVIEFVLFMMREWGRIILVFFISELLILLILFIVRIRELNINYIYV